MEPQTDPHRHEKHQFARQLAAELDGYQQKGLFDRLVIVAAPQTLGDLRGELSPQLQALVLAEVPKDLTKIPLPDLAGHLHDVMAV
jgi:protein required for attachment to host cells